MKTIKIQNNTDISPIYNAENIESVTIGKETQKVKYNVIDEYTLPIATYAEVFNYTDIDFHPELSTTYNNFALATNTEWDSNNLNYIIYDIDVVSGKPSCDYAEKIFQQNINFNNVSRGSDAGEGLISNDAILSLNYKHNGTFFINTNEVIYHVINIETVNVSNTSDPVLRIKNIEIGSTTYETLEDAQELYDNIVVLDFNEIFPMCARYWCIPGSGRNSIKTSAFDNSGTISKMCYTLSTFTGGYGQNKIVEGSGSGSGEGVTLNTKVEYWKQFANVNVPGTSTDTIYNLLAGKYYLSTKDDPYSFEVEDNDYNIYDVLFRQIHDYLYNYADSETEPTVTNPDNYTFLLKTNKIYIKKWIDPNERMSQSDYKKYYSASVLSEENIKTLDPEEAQKYFNNTIVYVHGSGDKVILDASAAYNKINVVNNAGNTCGTKCNKYFLISDNLCINEANRSTSDTYIDLGNFELLKAGCLQSMEIGSTPVKYICKSNTKSTKSREVYDPWNKEYLVITQNNAGSFSEEYEIERNSVAVKGVSGKKDIYYFNTTADGKTAAEQLADDIAYAIEDGPSIISCSNVAAIYFE